MKQVIETLTSCWPPSRPYLAQEMWEEQGKTGPVFRQRWPAYDEDLARETELEIPVQVNGKIRVRVSVCRGLDKAGLEAAVLTDEKVQAQIEGKTIVKVIAVPDKLIILSSGDRRSNWLPGGARPARCGVARRAGSNQRVRPRK